MSTLTITIFAVFGILAFAGMWLFYRAGYKDGRNSKQ